MINQMPPVLSDGELVLRAKAGDLDAFDALTSNRPYRTRVEPAEAIQYLREQAGILFDPLIVQTLENLFALGTLEGLDGK